MKKLLLTALLALTVVCAFAQSRYRVYMVRSGPWNTYTREYDTREHVTDMVMEFDNSVIRMSDDARSVYIVRNYREVKNDYQGSMAQWDGVDEKGRSVGVYMTFNKIDKTASLAVVYSDFMFQYYFYE
jgi:hypothetical protein